MICNLQWTIYQTLLINSCGTLYNTIVTLSNVIVISLFVLFVLENDWLLNYIIMFCNLLFCVSNWLVLIKVCQTWITPEISWSNNFSTNVLLHYSLQIRYFITGGQFRDEHRSFCSLNKIWYSILDGVSHLNIIMLHKSYQFCYDDIKCSATGW